MTVDFGTARQAMFGKSKLSKALESGFILSTRLDDTNLWVALKEACESYPEKKSVLGRYRPSLGNQRTVGFGRYSDAGGVSGITPSWTLRIGTAGPRWPISVVRAKMTSGKVDHVVEMELFLNHFEKKVRTRDAQANLSMVCPM